MSAIARTDVLNEMEVRETKDNKRLFFSIQFYKENGELVTLPRAHTCGLPYNKHLNKMGCCLCNLEISGGFVGIF